MEFQKVRIFHPEYAVVDYESASEIILDKAKNNISFGVSALAVHGLITSLRDTTLRKEINKIDLIVPDGQPIRWVINSFYNVGLKDRVYGPELTLRVLEKSNNLGLHVFLYGSTNHTLERFKIFIQENFPEIKICGVHVDRFREASHDEDCMDIEKINQSKANVVLVGRGCPRQEIWVANHIGKINAVMMAVGAAFDFHAGTVRQAPGWMQNSGLEWLFRLYQEPRRLWIRYLVTNTLFIFAFFKHKFILRRPY